MSDGSPEARWLEYYCARTDNDGTSAIMLVNVDLGFEANASAPGLELCNIIEVPLRDPHAFGRMGSAEEADVLDLMARRIEEAANEPGRTWLERRRTAASGRRARYVGCETGRGMRTLVVYSTEQLADEVYTRALASSPSLSVYELESTARREPDRSTYRGFLHPGGALVPLLLASSQLEELKRQGDDLDTEREVNHDLTFPSVQARQQFVDARRDEPGTQIDLWPEVKDNPATGEARYGVTVSLVHAVTKMITDIRITTLARQGARSGGTYEGWGTFAQRQPPG